MWLGCEHLRFYGIACEQHEVLYFDYRFWNKQEIVDFLMDLKYGDYDTYAKVIKRFPEFKVFDIHIINKKNKQAMMKYNNWRNENASLCEWKN